MHYTFTRHIKWAGNVQWPPGAKTLTYWEFLPQLLIDKITMWDGEIRVKRGFPNVFRLPGRHHPCQAQIVGHLT